MLIHPWDAATGSAEWQDWLAATDRFGMLAVNNLDPARAPLVLPVHFTVAGDELLMHLARPNPVWPHMEAAAEVRLAVTGDYAFIPTYWRAKAGGPDEDGVPTSSSAASSSAATGSTPGPRPSSGGAWPRSVTGQEAGVWGGTSEDERRALRHLRPL
jgi:Putative FMN-binding domain